MWTFDIATAPRGKTLTTTRTVKDRVQEISEFIPDFVWLATKCNKVVKSYWIPESGKSPARWSGLATGEQPIAWQAYVVPEHPFAAASQGEAAAPSEASVNPLSRSGSGGANTGGSDVDGSAERASRQSNNNGMRLAGGLEAGIDHSFVDETASGPDVKRAPLIVHKHVFLDDVGGGA